MLRHVVGQTTSVHLIVLSLFFNEACIGRLGAIYAFRRDVSALRGPIHCWPALPLLNLFI